jgi:hypothetical protein
MDARDEARIYMNAVIPEFEDAGGSHPSVDALTAYHQGRLSGSARAVVRDHLVACDECMALFKDADSFFAPPEPGGEGVSDVEVRRGWQALWRQIEAEEGAAVPARAVAPREAAWWGRTAWPLALAAGLLLAVGLPLAWIAWSRQQQQTQSAARQLQIERDALAERLRQLEDQNRQLREQAGASPPAGDSRAGDAAESEREAQRLREQLESLREKHEAELAELRQPQLNAPVYDVLPQQMTVRSAAGGEATRVELPPGRRSFTLILNGQGLPPYPQYDIEIRRGGRRVWRGTGLRQGADGNFVLTLDRSFLKEGEHRLKLFGRSGGAVKEVDEYVISVNSKPRRQRP